MPILFICSRECDYLQDLTFSGLSEILGGGQVFPFPFHWQYARERKHFWSKKLEYPRNLGTPPRSKPPFLNEKEIKQALRKNIFQCVILGSVKPDSMETFIRLKEELRVPWILLDGSDRSDVGGDFRRLGGDPCFDLFQSVLRQSPPALIFKREVELGKKRENIIFPFPFSIHAKQVPILDPCHEKKYQVTFWAVESSETRKKAFQILKGRYDCDSNGTVAGQKFRKYHLKGTRYFRALNESAVALSFRGEGFDTLRFWEAPACGALLISERPLIEMPHPFLHQKHAVFCKNDLSDLKSSIDYYLEREKESLDIAKEGQKHLLAFHTHARRAEYFLEIVLERLKIRF